jgi:lipid II:glycine glycyltransferase (peptidoglycan interpeptide bridge formation enzyme)
MSTVLCNGWRYAGRRRPAVRATTGGASDVLAESDSTWGVYRFKQGFGGEFTRLIGAWDYPNNVVAY